MNISSIAATFRAALIVVLIAAAGGGCDVLHSVRGQLALMSKRVPISRLIAAESTPPLLEITLVAPGQVTETSRSPGLQLKSQLLLGAQVS